MAGIGFYHLTRSGADQALPPLLGRTLAAGERALVLCGSEDRVAALDAALWLCANPDWLPHGTARSGHASLQPIWISATDDAANGARFLFLIDGGPDGRLPHDLLRFDRIFDLFDGGNDQAVAQARIRWKMAKDQDHTLTYWQQTDRGWEKKA
jgi:DNA polymerase-3 subunit chi